MKTIEDILEKQGFNEREAEAFMDIIKEAKILQKSTQLEDLKPYINKIVNTIAQDDD